MRERHRFTLISGGPMEISACGCSLNSLPKPPQQSHGFVTSALIPSAKFHLPFPIPMDPPSAECELVPSAVAEDSRHSYFMKQALLMVSSFPRVNALSAEQILQGEKALQSGETPVGCVLVHNDRIVGSGMNDTNRSMNVGLLRSCTAIETRSLMTPRGPDMPSFLRLRNYFKPTPDPLCSLQIST